MTAATAPDLSVIVPVRNEEGNILPLIEEIHAALDGVTMFEVIYADDGSEDGTAQKLLEAKAKFPRLRVVRHRISCGQSQAIHTAVRAAHAPWCAMLDGDGQNDPADIPELLNRRDEEIAAARTAAHLIMIVGWRRRRRDSVMRRLSSTVGNGVRNWLLDDDVPDAGCGLKIFSRAVFLAFPRFDHMHRYMTALIRREGGYAVSAPVNHRPREHGVSKYGVWDRLWAGVFDLMGVRWLQRRSSAPAIEPAD